MPTQLAHNLSSKSFRRSLSAQSIALVVLTTTRKTTNSQEKNAEDAQTKLKVKPEPADPTSALGVSAVYTHILRNP